MNTENFTRVDVKRFMQAVEDYRTAGGREEHFAFKDILQASIEDVLDGYNHWKALAESREIRYNQMLELQKENFRLKFKVSSLEAELQKTHSGV